jgi:hypothetical protein
MSAFLYYHRSLRTVFRQTLFKLPAIRAVIRRAHLFIFLSAFDLT